MLKIDQSQKHQQQKKKNIGPKSTQNKIFLIIQNVYILQIRYDSSCGSVAINRLVFQLFVNYLNFPLNHDTHPNIFRLLNTH